MKDKLLDNLKNLNLEFYGFVGCGFIYDAPFYKVIGEEIYITEYNVNYNHTSKNNPTLRDSGLVEIMYKYVEGGNKMAIRFKASLEFIEDFDLNKMKEIIKQHGKNS